MARMKIPTTPPPEPTPAETIAVLRSEVFRLSVSENQATKSRATANRKLKDAESRVSWLESFIRLDSPGVKIPDAAIPAELLPLMIRLCHPDRHQGSESANAVTAWLLKQRG